ncbi:diguanylate cyclase (GGDEF)-like protein [Acinetobacter calcoaceticus]|uniref:diguanylate cyclase n=1 Tax=Acinetobacter calcoaceticus TaxID=471 RepID=A0A4R1XVX6_ACICA|nr:diguanylate cyclase (GGDEF)-like protein [Acinetobacter calcoaceticus]
MKNLQFLMQNNIIMSWSNLRKCILILALACGAHILWIVWKIYVFQTPELWQWVNLPMLKFQLILNAFSLLCLALLIIPCAVFTGRKWAERNFPYIIISVFVLTFFRDGYVIGIFSPATITGYICISGIGLLLFERKIVYPPLLLATSALISLGYFTVNKNLPYAPIFSIDLMYQYPFDSKFWVSSMTFFIVPILMMSLILCEVLLMQWRYRESIIEKLSQIDPLTNLYNRRSFNQHMRLIHNSKKKYAIIILDLDHFKNINDQYGHSTGDEALKQIAAVLAKNVRESDMVARFGGEEFIILLQDTLVIKTIEIAERCRQSIKDVKIQINAAEYIQLTASFGIATSESNYDIEQIIRYADQALYRAKQQGRDQIQAYDHNLPLHTVR